MAAVIGKTPITKLPHLISNFKRFQSSPVYACNSQLCLCEYSRILKMVYYFVSNVVSPSATIYVGKDKFESEPSKHRTSVVQGLMYNSLDEELIKHGLESDVW